MRFSSTSFSPAIVDLLGKSEEVFYFQHSAVVKYGGAGLSSEDLVLVA